MEIRRYQAIGWARGIIYFGFGGMAAIAGAIFIAAGEGPAKVVGAVLIVSTAYIIARLLKARLEYGKAIAWYTRQGLAVIPNEARPVLEPRRGEMEADIESVIFWWAQKYPRFERRMRDFINGGELKVLYQDEPIIDRRWGIVARELTDGNSARVLWQPGNQGADFLALVRHAIGHMCLYGMGISNEGKDDHHARMNTDGFPDK